MWLFSQKSRRVTKNCDPPIEIIVPGKPRHIGDPPNIWRGTVPLTAPMYMIHARHAQLHWMQLTLGLTSLGMRSDLLLSGAFLRMHSSEGHMRILS